MPRRFTVKNGANFPVNHTPVFELVYLGPKPNPCIDFDWGAVREAAEIEEVSDVPATEDAGVFTISDPAVAARKKAEAKMAVRAAFITAEEARTAAEEMAARFYAEHDLSDSESAFSEWMSDSEADE